MPLLPKLIKTYLADARNQLDEFNDRFITEVSPSGRPFVEDVLGAYAVSLDVLQIIGEELNRSTPAPALAPLGAEIVAILSAEAVIEFVSATVFELLGYEREELVGRVAFELVHPDDLEAVRSQFAATSADSRRVADLRYRYRHKDGTWRAVVTHLQCIRHPHHPGLVAHSYIAREAL